jgi:hypothetical protein
MCPQVDVSDPTYKRSLEYLFFGECPMMAGELQRVPEDGFRHPHEYAALTGEGAVALSNSVSLSDLPRMQMRLDQQKVGTLAFIQGKHVLAILNFTCDIKFYEQC